MGIGMKLLAPFAAMGRGIKSFSMRWGGYGSSYVSGLLMPRSNFNYAAEIGDGSRSNIVQAVVGWIARTFPEAPVVVVKEQPDGTRERMHGHRLPKLLEKPNPYYSGVLMWMATITDWSLAGNAYWLKGRARGGSMDGAVNALWWAPSWTMEPKWSNDGSDYISHYEYRPGESAAVNIAVEDVVHFRYGLDAYNTRKGCSPLKTLMREIFTDEEGANMTAAMMRNMGVPGVVISPAAGQSITYEQAEETKSRFMEKTTGDRRGEPLVQLSATDVKILAFSPEQMLLRDLRRVPEERVSAIYGVAAVVVGLGAGLDRATFSNFAEAREAATEGNIIPTQRLIAADLTLQLLPDFESSDMISCEFDLTRVRALQPDVDKAALRMATLYRDGIAMRAEAKREMGLPVSADDFVYAVNRNVELLQPDNTGLGEETIEGVVSVTEEVQASALNGAQIASMLEVLQQVTTGLLAPDTARGLLAAAFPSLSTEEINSMVSSAVAFTPTVEVFSANGNGKVAV